MAANTSAAGGGDAGETGISTSPSLPAPAPTPQPTSSAGGGQQPEEDRICRAKFWQYVKLCYGSVLISLGILGVMSIIFGVIRGGLVLYLGYVGIALVTAGVTWLFWYSIASIQKIPPTEKGSKYFLDKYLHTVSSGPTFVPQWLCSIRTATIKLIVIRIGKPDPKRDDNGKIIEETKEEYPEDAVVLHYAEPWRVTFADHETAEWGTLTKAEQERFKTNDPLNRRLTTDPYMVIIGRVNNHRRFLETTATVEEAAFNIDRVARPALQEFCAKHTAAYTLQYARQAAEAIWDALEELVGDPNPRNDAVRAKWNTDPTGETKRVWLARTWGFDLIEVRLESLGLPRRINQEIANVRQAEYAKEKTIINADAEKEKRDREGQGVAAAKRHTGLAEAAVMAAKREVIIKDGGELIAGLETAATVVPNTKFMVVTPDNLYSTLAGGREALRQLKTAEKPAQKTKE